MPENAKLEKPTDPQFEVHSIHFSFPGNQAILLRDHVTDRLVGTTAEWVRQPPRNMPISFLRGLSPSIRVVFSGSSLANGKYWIWADGTLKFEETSVDLTFDPATGLSESVTFRMDGTLPGSIGDHSVRLNWYARSNADPDTIYSIGVSQHRIFTVWRNSLRNTAEGLHDWVYAQLIEWTCQWSAGLDDEKAICDAVICNLPLSGLQYGKNAHHVRQMLNNGGGMCGGWYQMFQQMAHCQGVFVHRRSFFVDWRQMGNGEDQWCALIVRNGGLNQVVPTHQSRTFHDNDVCFPVVSPVSLQTRTETRYCFRGTLSLDRYGRNILDGHCINFLEYDGRLFLYDACFATGPIEIDLPLPPDDGSKLGGDDLASFKRQYLDQAVDYMLGSLYNGVNGVFHKTEFGVNETIGMTVKTSCIPNLIQGQAVPLTFFWGR